MTLQETIAACCANLNIAYDAAVIRNILTDFSNEFRSGLVRFRTSDRPVRPLSFQLQCRATEAIWERIWNAIVDKTKPVAQLLLQMKIVYSDLIESFIIDFHPIQGLWKIWFIFVKETQFSQVASPFLGDECLRPIATKIMNTDSVAKRSMYAVSVDLWLNSGNIFFHNSPIADIVQIKLLLDTWGCTYDRTSDDPDDGSGWYSDHCQSASLFGFNFDISGEFRRISFCTHSVDTLPSHVSKEWQDLLAEQPTSIETIIGQRHYMSEYSFGSGRDKEYKKFEWRYK